MIFVCFQLFAVDVTLIIHINLICVLIYFIFQATESPLSVIPLEKGSQISEPAALTYMASNDVEKPMKIIQMDDNYPKVPDSEKATTEEFKTINRGKQK